MAVPGRGFARPDKAALGRRRQRCPRGYSACLRRTSTIIQNGNARRTAQARPRIGSPLWGGRAGPCIRGSRGVTCGRTSPALPGAVTRRVLRLRRRRIAGAGPSARMRVRSRSRGAERSLLICWLLRASAVCGSDADRREEASPRHTVPRRNALVGARSREPSPTGVRLGKERTEHRSPESMSENSLHPLVSENIAPQISACKAAVGIENDTAAAPRPVERRAICTVAQLEDV